MPVDVYRRWFQEGEEISLSPYLEQALRQIGQVPERVLTTANSAAVEQAYKTATDEAHGWRSPVGYGEAAGGSGTASSFATSAATSFSSPE